MAKGSISLERVTVTASIHIRQKVAMLEERERDFLPSKSERTRYLMEAKGRRGGGK